jgi:hypothetical protein
MDPEMKTLIERFNENIDWLRKNHGKLPYPSIPVESLTETMGMDEARQILKRGRTWISRRMVTAESIDPGIDSTQFLVYGLDWFREGSQIRFHRSSVIRLKQILRDMGDKYQRRSVLATA